MWATPSIRADIIGGLAVSYDLSVNGVLKQCIECEGVVPNCSLSSLFEI